MLLEAAESVEVELYVSYVVSKAKWSPKYDIRVFSSDNSMKVYAQNVQLFRTTKSQSGCPPTVLKFVGPSSQENRVKLILV